MTSRRMLVVMGILALSGCASRASVRAATNLPVRNVVLYRSGVGYFERAGTVSGEALEFEVEQREVGDFLASLTAIEKSSGGVRSVSFDVPEPPPAVDTEEEQAPAPAQTPRVSVRLELGERGKHDVSVSYVVGAPIWRPSYRVVFDQAGDPLLQAWAVVQNTSGEDWRDVRLSLTTGAPISFRSDLGTPIVPERPLVSDQGDVIQSVPVGEVAVAQESAAKSMEDAMPPDAMADGAPEREMAKSRASAPPPPPMPMAPSASVMEQQVRPAAQLSVLSESVTRYDLREPVTIPDGGSTMVAVLSQRVKGERAHLFAPDGGVAGSYQHPFAVARLENGTGAVLERGPVSVLAEGAFLGQGLFDTLPRGASAFVPFALDRSVVVESAEQYGEEQGALVRVSRGYVTVQRFSQRTTRYRVRNGGSEPVKLYVRHGRWGEAELVSPPQGTELTPGRALLPVLAKSQGKVELEVIERTPAQTDFVIMDQPAADAIALYLSGPAVDAAQGAALKKALELRAELVKVVERIGGKEREQAELERGSSETRKNLKAMEKVASAGDLRARLVERLRELDTQLASATKELVELRMRQSELEVRLSEALESVTLEVSRT